MVVAAAVLDVEISVRLCYDVSIVNGYSGDVRNTIDVSVWSRGLISPVSLERNDEMKKINK